MTDYTGFKEIGVSLDGMVATVEMRRPPHNFFDSLLIAGGIHAQEFGTIGGQGADLERIEAALRDCSYNPVGVAWSFRW